MKTYAFELRADGMTFWVRVQASNISRAKTIVLDWQKCPERSIQSWHIVPTEKQIAKTKSLLRGI